MNALEPNVREELVGNLTNRELTNYASVFSAHETGDFLGRIARRYDWIATVAVQGIHVGGVSRALARAAVVVRVAV